MRSPKASPADQVVQHFPPLVMVVVQWPSPEAFAAFQDDADHQDLHPLRESGTQNYLWWTYERLEDLRPLLQPPT